VGGKQYRDSAPALMVSTGGLTVGLLAIASMTIGLLISAVVSSAEKTTWPCNSGSRPSSAR
jgi:hypothetical protein